MYDSNPDNFTLGVTQSIFDPVAETFNDIPAVYGENDNTDYWGVGVRGKGGYVGVSGIVNPTGFFTYYGVIGGVYNDSDSGFFANPDGAPAFVGGGGTAYGVYGESFGNGTSYAGYFSGDLAYTSALIPASDERLKKNIKTMDGALSNVMKLRPTTYEFRRDENASMNLAKGHQFGFIAQEVGQVFPNLVHNNVHASPSDKDGKKTEYVGMDYVSLIPVLTAAIQEQQAQIAAQQAQIEELTKQVELLLKK